MMKDKKPKRKIIKRIFIVVNLVVLLLIVSGYFILKYRIKSVIEYAVDASSNGAYKIDIKNISFSFSEAAIHIQNAALKSVTQQDTTTIYGIIIPELYIRLQSWKSLLFEKKIAVDSLYLNNADINIYESAMSVPTHKATAFSFSTLANELDALLKQLAIKQLDVQNVKLTYYFSDKSIQPFTADKVNFSIRNFINNEKEKNRFLSADDIDIAIGPQQWKFPDSRNELSFSSLHFSGRKQYFEIDSCSFKTPETDTTHDVNISAEKFLFNSSGLTSLYLENKLLLDTLTCIHPVLRLMSTAKPANNDSANLLNNALQKLFTNIHFKYINIDDGQLYLIQRTNEKQTAYTTQKTDLRLFELNLNTQQSPSFSLGNIELELDTIQFYTPDSLYVLNVDDFSIYNNDLICRNASFVPVHAIKDGGMRLGLPQFVLKNINLQALLQKKLKAEYALFDGPQIFVEGSGKTSSNDSIKKPAGIDGLYTALHSFNSLIDVEAMYIQKGNLHFKTHAASKASVDAENMNAVIMLNNLFQSGSLIDIKKALSQISFDKVQFSSVKTKAVLKEVSIKGTLQKNYVKAATIKLASGATLNAKGITWEKLDWDLLYNSGDIYADSVGFDDLQLQYKQVNAVAKNKKKTKNAFTINNFNINKLNATIALLNGTNIKTNGSDLEITGLMNNAKGLQWQDIKAKLNDASYSKANTKITVGSAVLNKQNGTRFEHVNIVTNSGQFVLPEVKLATTINNTVLANLRLEYLILTDPQITLTAAEKKDDKSKPFSMPFNLSTDMLQVNKAVIKYSNSKDSFSFKSAASITIDSLVTHKEENDPLQYRSLKLHLANTEMQSKKIVMTLPSADLHLTQSSLHKTENGNIIFAGNAAIEWLNAAVKIKDSTQKIVRVSNFSGIINYPALTVGGQTKIGFVNIAEKLKLSDANLYYSTAYNTITIDKIKWNTDNNNIVLEKLHMLPNMPRDTFFKTSQWQKDYMEINCDRININNIDLAKYAKDTAIDIKEIILENASLATSRDKNIPFQHGIEKLMPTKLIQKIKMPLHINAVIVKNATITANEISAATKREGTIPLAAVNAEIKNINNRAGEKDSLYIRANAIMLDHYIRNLQYRESYADSLSGFRMTLRMSPMDLTALSKVTNPLAAVNIDKGHSDTLYERIAGNKYAAFGEMKFYYKHLNVEMLSKNDTIKKTFLLSMENFIANKFVVKTNNKKDARVFFIRDPEKFVFNYWIKSTFSGVMTSAGVKRNKKYERKYQNVKKQYTLPAVHEE